MRARRPPVSMPSPVAPAGAGPVTKAGAGPVAPAGASLLSEPTAAPTTRRRRGWRRLLAGPEQGWSSLLLLCVMLYATGLAVDGANWFGLGPDGGSLTAAIPLLLVLGGLSGALLTRLRITAGWQHIGSAVLGSAAVLILTANVSSLAPTLEQRLAALNASAVQFAHDVAIGVTLTDRTVLLLLLAAVAWTTGTFAAFAVFGRSRATPAIVATGALLLTAVASTVLGSYRYLVVSAMAAGLLVVRLNLSRQQQGWERRQIGGGGGVSALFLGGGLAVVVLTLVGAVGLAAAASPAPLDQAWRQLSDGVNELVLDLRGMITDTGDSAFRPVSGTFPAEQRVLDRWVSGPKPVFTATTSDLRRHYWWGAAYDSFDGQIWLRTESPSKLVPTGGDLLAGSAAAVDALTPGRGPVSASITWLGDESQTVLAPAAPLYVDRDAIVRQDGDGGPVTSIGLVDGVAAGDVYRVSSMIPLDPGANGALTQNELAAAGTMYPDWVTPYWSVAPGSVGDWTTLTARKLWDKLPADEKDPFHIATEMQDYLRSAPFAYRPDIANLCDAGETVSDCLLHHQQGFCQQFATAMAMMLRVLNVPARYVQGFLPGDQIGQGTFEVDASAAHAWVEVYFPGYGWIPFDPTPGLTAKGQQATTFIEGPPVEKPPAPAPSASPALVASPSPSPSEALVSPRDPNQPSAAFGEFLGLPVWLLAVVIAGLVLLFAAVVLLLRLRRFPGGSPELAYRGVTSLAARLGHGPTPTQTAYEYTAALSDVVPGMTQELHVVARSRVESVYAQRSPEGEGVATLRSAYQHVRLGLLRLVFRRGPRPRP